MEQKNPINCATSSIEELKRAYYSGIPIAGLEFIGTHYEPHNDEMGSGYFLQKTEEGRTLFPGIEKAVFGPISATKLRDKDLLGEQGFFKAMQAKILLIGIGCGPLDEHSNRHEHISCTERTVRLLGLMKEKDNRKVYGRLIRYINYEDGHGDNLIQNITNVRKEIAEELKESAIEIHKEEADMLLTLQIGSVAQNLKKGLEAAAGDPEKQTKVIQMAYTFYDNEIEQAKMFLSAEKAYDKNENLVDIVVPGNPNSFVMLNVKSDIPIMNKVVHSKWRDNRAIKLGVLFLHKSNGQFVLMPNMQHITSNQMREVAKILRQMVSMHLMQSVISFSSLGKNQIIDEVAEIHFDENTGIISNGSKTDPDVPGLIESGLTEQDVTRAIQIGLDTEYFPSNFKRGCLAGKCAKGACPIYNYGQDRCHSIRNKAQASNSPMGTALTKAGVGS